MNIESGSDHKTPFHLYNKLRIKLETFYNKKKIAPLFLPRSKGSGFLKAGVRIGEREDGKRE